jgi:hypothetical protein
MGFKTKIDLSNGRQAKKRQNSTLHLPGTTKFGDEQDDLITGPDLDTVRVLVPSVDNVTSTFTGNTGTGIYTYSFGIADMAEAEDLITHFTLDSQEGEEQFIGPVWVGKDPVDVGGTQVYTRYEGVKFDLTLAEITDLGNGDVSGSTRSTYEKLEADALDYSGNFEWVDVRGTTRTKGLVIEQVGTGPSTIDLGLDANGNAVNTASDIRLKENIEPIQDALQKVLALEGVTYNWKDRSAGGDDLRLGFIAQQVKEVVPELVHDVDKDGYLGVYYNHTVALLVEAIKELSNQYNDFTPLGGIPPQPTETSERTVTRTNEIDVERILSEDNNIEMNYGGTHETALDGGLMIINGVSEGTHSKFTIDEDGDWNAEPNIKIKQYTPISSDDPQGNVGNISRDDNYIYIKTSEGWKRSGLEKF